ncbi:MAG: carbohydrate ABC transporter permease [bacterium]
MRGNIGVIFRKVASAKGSAAYLLILPGFTLYFLFRLMPTLSSVLVSFFKWEGFGKYTFVGFGNFIQLIEDEAFRVAFKNSIIFAILTVTVQCGLALLLALALETGLRFSEFFQSIYFMPTVLAPVVVAMIFGFLFSTTRGPLGEPLNRLLGIQTTSGPGSWYRDPRRVFFIFVSMQVWREFGISMFLFLAGLRGIPQPLYEAAKVDGAGPWQILRFVTLPLLKRIIFLVIALSTIGSLKAFDIIYVMSGRRASLVEVMSTYTFRQAFHESQIGLASASSSVLLLVALVFVSVQLWIRRGISVELE